MRTLGWLWMSRILRRRLEAVRGTLMRRRRGGVFSVGIVVAMAMVTRMYRYGVEIQLSLGNERA